MNGVDRCACCGAIVPEGRQVYRICERAECLHLWQFDQVVVGESGERYLSWKCVKCGRSRLEKRSTEALYRSMYDG